MIDTDDRPTVEESYISASNTSNLSVKAERRGDGDVIICAGWSRSRTGQALMRLRSEWDAAEKPRAQSAEAIQALARTLSASEPGPLQLKQAQDLAANWLLQAQMELMGKLKSLPDVREQLALDVVDKWRVIDSRQLIAKVIKHWLSPACSCCQGRRWQMIPGTPMLSSRACGECHGGGVAPVPAGEDGRHLLGYIEDCLRHARGSIGRRLRNTRSKV